MQLVKNNKKQQQQPMTVIKEMSAGASVTMAQKRARRCIDWAPLDRAARF
jgi:hypothetical protein